MAFSTSQADNTFKGFSVTQAADYAQLRGSYPQQLYEFIARHHEATGGKSGLVVDIGCGPGNVTRDVARHFDEAIGVDHGEDMIKAAAKMGGETAAGNPIRYCVSSAEDFDSLREIAVQGVDLITVGTAAHWFDMAKFWSAAANVVKPGGTVAIWAYTGKYCHPSVPGAEKAHKIMLDFDEKVLGPYMQPGNRTVRNGYKDLVLPWAPECAENVRTAFDEPAFKRQEWNANGVPSNDGDFFGGSREVTLAGIEKLQGTGSPVVRWREAHPDLVGTEQDCVRVMSKQIQEALGIKDGEENTVKIKVGTTIVLLLVKRS